MKKFINILLSLLLTHFILTVSTRSENITAPTENNSYDDKVSIIPLSGTIDGGIYRSLTRRVEIAKENGSNLIIIEIDTFGGQLEPAFEISEYISNIKNTKTVAFIPTKAISAGSLIAISCNEIYMSPQAELGDCEPIVPSSEGGYKTVGEKIQTVLRTKFRKFAEKNGYPVLLAEAMVTKEIEVYRIVTEEKPDGFYISGRELKEMTEETKKGIKSRKLIIEEGKLLTMHAKEAYEYQFAKGIVEDRNGLLSLLNVENATPDILETNWSEEMVRFLAKIAPILLGIGLAAIWMEFKSPGFGLPGIIGISCLATVFLSKHLVGLAEAPEIIIFFSGIVLIAVEILLIPGFGIAGIPGIILILIGAILSFQDFTIPRTPYDVDMFVKNIFAVMCSIIGSGITIFLLFRFMPGIPFFNRLVLTTSETAQSGYVIPPQPAGKSSLPGTQGLASTTLHPTGKIEVNNNILDVVTEGEYIEKGQIVEIIEIRGNIIVVKAV
ncbi:membrane-bound serine protease [Candidatus Scalindua japonica]|uniref:Membrane-bound serine protease n=1 Tax=Candidatus Scalindua japonica TaxID=1284222 RepID=A0A286U4F5_9BACT|nr:NfeD family protein [Candidatus Scalindua japonica]GAX63017.1 membrane-bound serine protease [Candidatus Scalindua japonica]